MKHALILVLVLVNNTDIGPGPLQQNLGRGLATFICAVGGLSWIVTQEEISLSPTHIEAFLG